MENKIKYFLIAILIISLISPKPAFAFLGTGIFDYFDTALGGVEEGAGPVFAKLLGIFFVYVVGLIAINVSAGLLQLTISHPEWLSVNNDMVRTGWHFCAGIANMLLILIAIFIALTIILKLETFQGKKAFIRLIFVAILINFSLVFIGMLIDSSNLAYNAILAGNENLPFKFIEKFGATGMGVLINLIAWLVALIVAFVIPFIAPFAQLGLFIALVSTAFFPTFIQWFFQIFSFFAISGLFFTYAFLFGARVFIVQLLAILSPLAFLFFILPQTKKYWDEWLHHLLEWIFFGIALFLFLVIGLKATDQLMPASGTTIVPLFGWGVLTDYFIYYFFLLIYLIVAIWLSKKYMPTLASAIIAQGAALVGFVWGKGIKPIGRAIGEEAGRRGPLREKLPERVKKWGDRQLIKPRWGAGVPGVKGTVMRAVGTAPYALRRGLGVAVGEAGVAETERKYMQRAEVKAKERDVVGNLATLRVAISKAEKAGILTAMIDKKQIKAALDENIVGKGNTLSNQEVLTSYRKARELKDKDVIENIEFSFADLAKEFAKIIDKETAGYTEDKRTKEGLDDEDRKVKGYTSYTDKIMDAVKSADDIKKLRKGWWETPESIQAAHKFWTGSQIGKAGEAFGREFVEEYMRGIDDIIKEHGVEGLIRLNPKAALYLSGNPAQDLGFRSPKGLRRKDIQEKIQELKEQEGGEKERGERGEREPNPPFE
jgi:hypothetical protein